MNLWVACSSVVIAFELVASLPSWQPSCIILMLNKSSGLLVKKDNSVG